MSNFSISKFLSNSLSNAQASATVQGANFLRCVADRGSKEYARASSSYSSFHSASAEKISAGLTSGSVFKKEVVRMGSEAFASMSQFVARNVDSFKNGLMNHVVDPVSSAAYSGLKESGSAASSVGYAAYLAGKGIVKDSGKGMRSMKRAGSAHLQQACTRFQQADERVQVAVMTIVGVAAIIPLNRAATALNRWLWNDLLDD